MEEKRQYPRYACPGGVEIHIPDTHRRLWGHLGDISKGGLYLEAPEPWLVGTEVDVHLETCDTHIHAVGTIVTCHPGVGMGIAFKAVDPQDLTAFEKAIQGLASTGDGRAIAVTTG